MKSAIQPQWWLSFHLLAILAGNLAAQAPQPPQPLEEPAVKLPALLTAKPIDGDYKDDELRKLLKARYNEAVAEMQTRYREFRAGRGTFAEMEETAKRLVQSGLELSDKPAERAALLTQYVELAKEVEKIIQARVDAGRIEITLAYRARYQRLDAEIQLLRAKRQADKVKGK